MTDSNAKFDEQRIIQQVLEGETSLFGGLVIQYQNRLFNSLIQVLGCEVEAQDVTQDAFVQAFRRLDSFRGQSSFYTWLFRIARNLAISRIRSRRTTHSLYSSDGSTVDVPGKSDRPEDRMVTHESVNQLRLALSKLSEEHRTIIVLREFENLDYDAIGDILEIPVGTVRSRLHRARGQLKEELESLGVTPD